jgi:hypothetical protein
MPKAPGSRATSNRVLLASIHYRFNKAQMSASVPVRPQGFPCYPDLGYRQTSESHKDNPGKPVVDSGHSG